MGCEYIFLINDDVFPMGDVTSLYIDASKKTGIKFFCFHRWPDFSGKPPKIKKIGNTEILFSNEQTGHWLFLTRDVIEKIGYFDVKFGKFASEHVDYTRRAQCAGFYKYDFPFGVTLDVKEAYTLLTYQKVDSTFPPVERAALYRTGMNYYQQKWGKYNKLDSLYEHYKERL